MTDLVSTVIGAPQTQSQVAGAGLADTFDTFLQLLTAQLRNQDPLDPQDPSEFTNQLVQFSGVEQAIQTNSLLERQNTLMQFSSAANLSGFLGKTALIDAREALIDGEPAHYRYILPEGVASTRITIVNEQGRIVHSAEGLTAAGEHDYTWDGQIDGLPAPAGRYVVTVAAVDADGQDLGAGVGIVARIGGVDLSGSTLGVSTSVGVYAFERILRLDDSAAQNAELTS